MTDRVRLVAIGGLACACAQSLLDRSGIVPFGGGASSFPQQVTWAVLALVSALALFYLYRERRPRAVVGRRALLRADVVGGLARF